MNLGTFKYLGGESKLVVFCHCFLPSEGFMKFNWEHLFLATNLVAPFAIMVWWSSPSGCAYRLSWCLHFTSVFGHRSCTDCTLFWVVPCFGLYVLLFRRPSCKWFCRFCLGVLVHYFVQPPFIFINITWPPTIYQKQKTKKKKHPGCIELFVKEVFIFE